MNYEPKENDIITRPGFSPNKVLIDYTGRTFSRLTVLGEAPRNINNGHRMVNVVCVCGTVNTVDLNSLRYGGAQSCGCLAKERASNRLKRDPDYTPPRASAETARAMFGYNQKTGDLLWKPRLREHSPSEAAWSNWNGRWASKPVGCVDTKGYLTTNFCGRSVRVHRIILLMHTGEFPKVVDHIDGDKLNNRLDNLRVATPSQNQHNQGTPSTNRSGVKGVWFVPRTGKWASQIRVDGVRHTVGSFETLHEATEAVRAAREKFHGEFANHG